MECTHHEGDKFSAIMGLRADYYKDFGIRYSPRVTLKYTPFEDLVLRANAGRGLRRAMPLVDNIGVLSTSKNYLGSFWKTRGLSEETQHTTCRSGHLPIHISASTSSAPSSPNRWWWITSMWPGA